MTPEAASIVQPPEPFPSDKFPPEVLQPMLADATVIPAAMMKGFMDDLESGRTQAPPRKTIRSLDDGFSFASHWYDVFLQIIPPGILLNLK